MLFPGIENNSDSQKKIVEKPRENIFPEISAQNRRVRGAQGGSVSMDMGSSIRSQSFGMFRAVPYFRPIFYEDPGFRYVFPTKG